MKIAQKSNLIIFAFCIGILFVVSCSKEDKEVIPETSPGNYDKTPLLTNYSNEYIVPAYSSYYTAVNNLKNEVTSFNSGINVTSLQSLRAKWESALLIWQDVAFLEFGPASIISLRAQTNVYPVDTALVNNNIFSGTYNLQAGSNFDAKGFQALDYLLNGTGDTDADVVSYFTNTPNASTYLQDVADELESNANTVNTAWQGSYSTTFINNGASNAQGSAVSDVVNALVLHYEAYIRKGKIGLPAGSFNGFSQLPMPYHVESYYDDKSLPYVYRSLIAIQNFIKGKGYITTTNGEGLDDYMDFVNAQTGGQLLSTAIDNQFGIIDQELSNINDPLSEEVITNTQGVVGVYQKMQQMVPFLKVDMTNALEVLITYQDNDGD